MSKEIEDFKYKLKGIAETWGFQHGAGMGNSTIDCVDELRAILDDTFQSLQQQNDRLKEQVKGLTLDSQRHQQEYEYRR